jgi:hypothetical protein
MHVRRRAAALLAAAGLTAGLLPLAASSAEADPTGPAFGYVTADPAGRHDATTDRLWFTQPGSFANATNVTPNMYARQYDVSEDGNVLLVWGQSRSLASPELNSTYGLILVVRDPVTGLVTSKILTSFLQGNPVLARDGSAAYWYDFHRPWRYDVASGQTSVASERLSNASTSTGTERVVRLAVSPDGSKVAAMFARFDSAGNLVSTRVRALAFAATFGAYDEAVRLTATSVQPVPQTLTWNADSTAFYFTRAWPNGDLETVRATTAPASDVVVPEWANTYDVALHAGTFYLFRDVYGTTGKYVRTDVGTSAAGAAPSDWLTFPPAASGLRYRPTSAAPPVVPMPAVRAVPQASIVLDPTTIPTHGRVQYQTIAKYLTDASGFRRPDDQGRETRYGVLSVSTNGGATYRPLATTSGATLKESGAEFTFNGATTALTRNSLLRWCFRGDLLVQAGCSTPKKVIVKPTIATAVERKGSRERVYGKAARVGGTATLQWVIGYGNVTIASAPISSTGRFSFGFRDLRAGKYRVITTADSSWGQGNQVFLVR